MCHSIGLMNIYMCHSIGLMNIYMCHSIGLMNIHMCHSIGLINVYKRHSMLNRNGGALQFFFNLFSITCFLKSLFCIAHKFF